MCSKCQDVLVGFTIPHQISACPLLRSSYCSVCCSYGHYTQDCPDEEVCQSREIQFVEQLIPYSLREHYGITTTTPINNEVGWKKPRFQPVLEIIDNDKEIRQVLMNYDIQPSGKSKEIRKQLTRLGDILNRKVVLITPK